MGLGLGSLWGGLSFGAKSLAVGAGLLALPTAAHAAAAHPAMAAGLAALAWHQASPTSFGAALTSVQKALPLTRLQRAGLNQDLGKMLAGGSAALAGNFKKKAASDFITEDELTESMTHVMAYESLVGKQRGLNSKISRLSKAQGIIGRLLGAQDDSVLPLAAKIRGGIEQKLSGVNAELASIQEKVTSLEPEYLKHRQRVDMYGMERALKSRTGRSLKGHYAQMGRYQGGDFLSKKEIDAINSLSEDELNAQYLASKNEMYPHRSIGRTPLSKDNYTHATPKPLTAKEMQRHAMLTMRAHQEGLVGSEEMLQEFHGMRRAYSLQDRPQQRTMRTFYNDAVKRMADIQAADLAETTNMVAIGDHYRTRSLNMLKMHTNTLGEINGRQEIGVNLRDQEFEDYSSYVNDAANYAHYSNAASAKEARNMPPLGQRTRLHEGRNAEAKRIARYMAGING